MSEEEVIRFYNARGASERNFDVQNNDFGWAHLPFSFMNENAVFMLLTAMIKNFYLKNGDVFIFIGFSRKFMKLLHAEDGDMVMYEKRHKT